MFWRLCLRSAAGVLACWLTEVSVAHAQETASAEALAAAIERLDAAEFADRQAATQALREAGAAAIPALEQAAAADSREVSQRALQLLQRHLSSGDAAAQQAARGALARIVAHGPPAAVSRAGQILNPAATARRQRPSGLWNPNAPGLPIPIARLPGNPLGPAVPGAPRIPNGRRSLEVDQLGKRTKIIDLPDGTLEVEISQPRNGAVEVRRLQARDLADLRRQDAATADLYERFQRVERNPLDRLPLPFPPSDPRPVQAQSPAPPGALR